MTAVPPQRMGREFAYLSLILAVATIATAPMLLMGAPYGHSHVENASWLHGFSRQLHAGEWYPRWITHLNGGAGSPVFFFYAPLPFYVAAIFGPLFCPGCRSSIHLAIGQWLILAASGFTFYAFARQRGRAWVAAIGALIYMGMPYHFEIDLWRRQAFGEFTAYVWMPLILLFLDKAFTEGRCLPACAVSYAALVASHPPATLLFSLLLVAYAVFVSASQQSLRPLLVLGGTIGLGVGLAALYVVPALYLQDAIHAERLWEEYYDYAKWLFLTGQDTPDRAFGARIFIVLIVATSMCGLLSIVAYRARRALRGREAGFWLFSVVFVWFMVSPLSVPLWEYLPGLRKIQFPWRFCMLADLAVASMAVFSLEGIVRHRDRVSRFCMGLAAVLFGLLALSGSRQAVGLLEPLMPGSIVERYNERIAAGFAAPEYIPVWATAAPDILIGTLRIAPEIEIAETGDVQIVQRRSREIHLQVQSEDSGVVTIKQFYFPGWRARDTDSGEDLRLSATEKTGLLSLDVPAGQRNILLSLHLLWEERLGLALSVATLIVLIGMAAIRAHRAVIVRLRKSDSRLMPLKND